MDKVIGFQVKGSTHELLIDEQDADLVAGKSIYLHSKGYPMVGRSKLHQLIALRMLGRPVNKSYKLSHKNRNKLDVRRSNLVEVLHRQTCFHPNKSCPGSFYKKSRGKWEAAISVNGKTRYLGIYNTPQEASSVYLQALRDLTA